MTLTTARVAIIAARVMNIPPETIYPETEFADIGMKSLDAVDLIIGCDEEFGVSLGDNVYKLRTVEALAAHIDKAVENAA